MQRRVWFMFHTNLPKSVNRNGFVLHKTTCWGLLQRGNIYRDVSKNIESSNLDMFLFYYRTIPIEKHEEKISNMISYTAKVNSKSWLELGLSSHLRDSGPPLYLLSYQANSDWKWVFIQTRMYSVSIRRPVVQKRLSQKFLGTWKSTVRYFFLQIFCVATKVLGPVVRKPDSAIHRIVIFSSFLKLSVDRYNPD